MPSKAVPPSDAFTTEATLRALQDISVATNAAHDPATVAELAVARAKTLTGADGAVVFAYDAPTRLLLPLHETESAIEEPPCRPGQGAIGMAFKSGAPVVVDDYRTWKHALPESQVRGMVSALAVPLLSDDRPIGALGVWTYTPRDFTERETQLLTLFAAQLAPALEGARLTEEAQAKARMFQALHEVAVASSGVFDTETLGRLVVERAVTLLGLEGAGLWWWDGDDKLLNPVAWQDAREGWTIGPYKSGEGAVGSAFAGRHEMVIEDYQGWTGAASAAKHAGSRPPWRCRCWPATGPWARCRSGHTRAAASGARTASCWPSSRRRWRRRWSAPGWPPSASTRPTCCARSTTWRRRPAGSWSRARWPRSRSTGHATS